MSSARRPSSVSRIARARSASPRCSDFDRSRNTARSAASAVSFDFPGMLGLHSPHPRQTIHSVAHSQAPCLVAVASCDCSVILVPCPRTMPESEFLFRCYSDPETCAIPHLDGSTASVGSILASAAIAQWLADCPDSFVAASGLLCRSGNHSQTPSGLLPKPSHQPAAISKYLLSVIPHGV